MEFLHLAYKIPPIYEKLRKKLVNEGDLSSFLRTYQNQRIFFPDKNSGVFWDDIFMKPIPYMPMEMWRIKKILSLVDGKKSLLNIGVGRGALEEIIFKKYPEIDYTGTDITAQALRRLKKKFKKHAFLYQELPILVFVSDSIDQVMLLEVLEHIKPNLTFKVLSEIHRVLKPNGILILSIPTNEHLEVILPTNPNSHMRMYSEDLIKTELRLSGFSIEKIYRASAFHHLFLIKHIINLILRIREPNNLIILARKV